jgi:hypothetical protein
VVSTHQSSRVRPCRLAALPAGLHAISAGVNRPAREPPKHRHEKIGDREGVIGKEDERSLTEPCLPISRSTQPSESTPTPNARWWRTATKMARNARTGRPEHLHCRRGIKLDIGARAYLLDRRCCNLRNLPGRESAISCVNRVGFHRVVTRVLRKIEIHTPRFSSARYREWQPGTPNPFL